MSETDDTIGISYHDDGTTAVGLKGDRYLMWIEDDFMTFDRDVQVRFIDRTTFELSAPFTPATFQGDEHSTIEIQHNPFGAPLSAAQLPLMRDLAGRIATENPDRRFDLRRYAVGRNG